MSPKIKAVFFDMDGVLVDATDWHYEALNRALSIFGMTISRYDHLFTYDGLPTRQKLEMLSRERGLPRALHDFVSRMKQIYTLEIVHANCKPRFAHEYALSRLKSEGFFLALCSNSIRDTIDLIMKKARLSQHLDLILSNEDVKKGKPDPEMYLKAISRFGLKPQECLIVEDNPHGIQAALDSGAHLLKVKGIEDVTYQIVRDRILRIEQGTSASASIPMFGLKNSHQDETKAATRKVAVGE